MVIGYKVALLYVCLLLGSLAAMEPKKLALTGYAHNFSGDDGDSALPAERSRALLALEVGAGFVCIGTAGVGIWRWLQKRSRQKWEKARVESAAWLEKKSRALVPVERDALDSVVNVLVDAGQRTNPSCDKVQALVNLFDHIQRAETDFSQYVEKEKLHKLLIYAVKHLREPLGDDAESKSMKEIFIYAKRTNPYVFGSYLLEPRIWREVVHALLGTMANCRTATVGTAFTDKFFAFESYYLREA